MIRLRFLFLACLLALPAWANPDCLTLAFQGNVGGKIENCGCPKNPLGGLAHRAAMLTEFGASCPNLLLVDAGNLFGSDDFEGGLAQTELLLRETHAMGYRLLGIGARELAFGLEFAQKLDAGDSVHLVSSNLLQGGENVFAPSRIETVGGVRVAFLSVLAADELPAGLSLQDPREAVLHHLAGLRTQCDVVVLLSNLERGETRKLLESLPAGHGIDFAIDGQTRDHWARPQEINGTRLLAANPQGKYLGELKLTLDGGHWTGDSTFELHAVELDGPTDEQVRSRVERFVAERDRLAAGQPGR